MRHIIAGPMHLLLIAAGALLAACGGGGSAGGAAGDAPGGDSGAAGCAVVMGNDITVPTRLVNTTAACDYLLQGSDPLIEVRSTLVIDPGVVVRAAKDTVLSVNGGEIIAIGRPEARIVIEGASPLQGYWGGIRFGTVAGASRFEYVDLKDAGQSCTRLICPEGAMVSFGGGAVELRHSTVSNSGVNGVNLGDNLVGFAANRFHTNRKAGLVASADTLALLDTASDYAGGSQPNGTPQVVIATGSALTRAATWKRLPVAYRVAGFVDIDAALVIEPGATFLLGSTGPDSGDFISVERQGSIQAVGTADAPIVFDRVPGSPGWDGIGFNPFNTTTGNRFEHVHMAHGGQGTFAGAFLRLGDAQVRVANSRFENSRGAAIVCSEPGRLVLGPGNRFSNNAVGDLGLDCQ